MDFLKTDINADGMPIVLDDFRFMQKAYYHAFTSIMNALYPNVILHGCETTDNGNGTITIAEGAVSIDGEICKVEQQTINYNPSNHYLFEVEEIADPDGNKMFGDNTSYDTYILRHAIVVLETQQNYQFPNPRLDSRNLLSAIKNRHVPFNTNEIVLSDNSGRFITTAKKTAFNKDFGLKQTDIPKIGEHGLNTGGLSYGIVMYDAQDSGLNSISPKSGFNKNFGTTTGTVSEGHTHPYEPLFNKNTAFNKNFATKEQTLAGTSETTVINPKQLQEHEDWQTATLFNGWTGYCKFRKTTDNKLELVGRLVGDITANSDAFQLPELYRVTNEIDFLYYAEDIGGGLAHVAKSGELNATGLVGFEKDVAVLLNISVPLDY